MSTSTAEMLTAVIKTHGSGHHPEPITDGFAKAFARQLQGKGITGQIVESTEAEQAEEWKRRVLDALAVPEPPQHEPNPESPKTPAQTLADALTEIGLTRGSNGADVLRAAFAGELTDAVSGRMDATG